MKTYNVVNHEAPATWLEGVVAGSPDHIKRWFMSTLLKSIKNDPRYLMTVVLK